MSKLLIHPDDIRCTIRQELARELLRVGGHGIPTTVQAGIAANIAQAVLVCGDEGNWVDVGVSDSEEKLVELVKGEEQGPGWDVANALRGTPKSPSSPPHEVIGRRAAESRDFFCKWAAAMQVESLPITHARLAQFARNVAELAELLGQAARWL